MELQGWQTATKLFSGRKKFYCGTDTTGQGRQTLGGTPFADTARGGCDTDPITTSYVSQKIYRKKNLHKPIKLLALCQILFCSGLFSLENPLYILLGVFTYICISNLNLVYYNMKKVDMGKYILLIGNDATEVFDYYDVPEMHGLNRKDAQAEEVDKTKGNGVYIYGWTNYDPADKKLTTKAPYKPFLFINLGAFKKYSITEKATGIMHETMHMSILLNNWKIMDKEEEVIGFAEDEANKIIEKLGVDKKEKPKNGFFKK